MAAWKGPPTLRASRADLPARGRRGVTLAGWASVHNHPHQVFQPVGFLGRLVPADAVDAGKAHGDARFVPARAMHRVEGDLEHEPWLDLAHGTEAVDGVIAHPAVELEKLGVGEAEIGLAYRHELGLAALRLAPGAEGVVGIIGRALAAAP